VAPENSFYCTSLGIAEYREGNWTQAVEWLQKAVQLQSGQAMAPEQFFLAMTLWQQSAGPNDEADQYFDAAVEWMQSHRPGNRQLQRIYEEAKQLRETRKTSPGT
jgi:tetratricopeptide (TPR) repeat protein